MSINLSVTSTGLPSYTLCILFKSCLFWIRFQSVLWILCYPPWLFTLLHITFGLFPFVSALLLLPIVPPSAFCCLSWIQFKSVLCVFFLVTHRDSTLLHFTFGSFPLRVSEVLPSWPWFYTAPPKGGPGPPFEILGPPFHKPRGGLGPPFRFFFKKSKKN